MKVKISFEAIKELADLGYTIKDLQSIIDEAKFIDISNSPEEENFFYLPHRSRVISFCSSSGEYSLKSIFEELNIPFYRG